MSDKNNARGRAYAKRRALEKEREATDRWRKQQQAERERQRRRRHEKERRKRRAAEARAKRELETRLAAELADIERRRNPDDRRHRPSRQDPLLTGQGRVTGMTALAVKRGQAMTRWQYQAMEGKSQ